MNGVTGRMGLNQHLRRSIHAIRQQGGVSAGGNKRIWPNPILVGRNAGKLEAISRECGDLPWTTDLGAALSDPKYSIYFDAQTTDRRVEAVTKAIAAGKHIYIEKPIAETYDAAYNLYRLASSAGVKHGVVQDKLWVPGLLKLKTLRDLGFFGQIISVRGEFGYWVFEGDTVPAQRPSWNYRKEDGGGIIIDMLCHWRYVLDNLFGAVKAVSCRGATHIPQRWDEAGKPYDCTADDSAYATFELEGGIIAHFNSSWCVRVRRDDLLTIQVDGTKGSAVAGLRHAEEVLSARELPKPGGRPLDAIEVKMAQQLVSVLEAPFQPEDFRDEYRDRVMKFIEAKAKGSSPKLTVVKRKQSTTSLLDALSASLQKAKSAGGKAVA